MSIRQRLAALIAGKGYVVETARLAYMRTRLLRLVDDGAQFIVREAPSHGQKVRVYSMLRLLCNLIRNADETMLRDDFLPSDAEMSEWIGTGKATHPMLFEDAP